MSPEEAKAVAKPGLSGKAVIGWGLGMLAFLALCWFVAGVVVPAWRTCRIVEEYAMWPLISHEPAFVEEARLAEILRKLGGPEKAVRRLGFYLRLPGRLAPHRWAATLLLGECGALAVPALIGLLADEGAGIRITAVRFLGKIGDVRAIEPLAAALEDENEDVRVAVANSLGKIGGERAAMALARFIKDCGGDDPAHGAAVRALQKILLGTGEEDETPTYLEMEFPVER